MMRVKKGLKRRCNRCREPKVSKVVRKCRICGGGGKGGTSASEASGSNDHDWLLSPCRCHPSVRPVHRRCLEWRLKHTPVAHHRTHCWACGFEYRWHWLGPVESIMRSYALLDISEWITIFMDVEFILGLLLAMFSLWKEPHNRLHSSLPAIFLIGSWLLSVSDYSNLPRRSTLYMQLFGAYELMNVI